MDYRIERVAVGGAGGTLGQEIVKGLLKANKSVVAICRDEREASALGKALSDFSNRSLCEFEFADLSAPDDVAALSARWKSCQAVINAAGAFRWVPVIESKPSDFELLVKSNLTTTWNLIRYFLPAMIESNFGRMIFVSSKATLGTGAPGVGLYTAAKAGINMLVQSAAEEVKALDININAVLPSIIDNPQNRIDMPKANPESWVSPEGLAEFMLGLLSPISRHLNGALIPVSGRV